MAAEGSDSDDETEESSEIDSYAASTAPKKEEKPREASPPTQRKAQPDQGALSQLCSACSRACSPRLQRGAAR